MCMHMPHAHTHTHTHKGATPSPTGATVVSAAKGQKQRAGRNPCSWGSSTLIPHIQEYLPEQSKGGRRHPSETSTQFQQAIQRGVTALRGSFPFPLEPFPAARAKWRYLLCLEHVFLQQALQRLWECSAAGRNIFANRWTRMNHKGSLNSTQANRDAGSSLHKDTGQERDKMSSNPAMGLTFCIPGQKHQGQK